MEFVKLSDEKIYDAKVTAYNSDLTIYNSVVEARKECVDSIATRETYRQIFVGINEVFTLTSSLPIEPLFQSRAMGEYAESLRIQIDAHITKSNNDLASIKETTECPKIPDTLPIKPTR